MPSASAPKAGTLADGVQSGNVVPVQVGLVNKILAGAARGYGRQHSAPSPNLYAASRDWVVKIFSGASERGGGGLGGS